MALRLEVLGIDDSIDLEMGYQRELHMAAHGASWPHSVLAARHRK
jgi:hypothetical protein